MTELIQAGSRVLAATIASIAPLSVIKASDQSLSSTTTLQNDNALTLPLSVENATYLFWCYLEYTGGTQGASDIKIAFNLPTGATLRYQPIGIGTAGGMGFGATVAGGTSQPFGSSGTSNTMGANLLGSLFMSTTTGSLTLQWAQNSSNGTSTTVKAQSALTLWRIS